jgi:hypothetical protein
MDTSQSQLAIRSYKIKQVVGFQLFLFLEKDLQERYLGLHLFIKYSSVSHEITDEAYLVNIHNW